MKTHLIKDIEKIKHFSKGDKFQYNDKYLQTPSAIRNYLNEKIGNKTIHYNGTVDVLKRQMGKTHVEHKTSSGLYPIEYLVLHHTNFIVADCTNNPVKHELKGEPILFVVSQFHDNSKAYIISGSDFVIKENGINIVDIEIQL